MPETLMNRMSWVAYRDRVQDGGSPVFLPVGATEQHGPHLPLGTDALLASAVSESAARLVDGIVAPAFAYGFKSQPKCGGGNHFCGTTSLDAQTLAAQVRDAVREFARHGVTRLVIVNGHYENQWFLIEGIDLAMRELGPTSPLTVMRLEYWDFFTPETLAKVFPDGFPGYALEHAAVMETSMMLHFHPDLVRLDLIPDDPPADFPPYDIYPTRTDWVPPSGVLSSAKGASRDKGQAMADEVAKLIATAVRTEFGLGPAL
ncbi:MAG: creatininase [Burkholderiales bacterium]|nr:creatininase [Burkholderiales bacterium]